MKRQRRLIALAAAGLLVSTAMAGATVALVAPGATVTLSIGQMPPPPFQCP